MGTEILEEHITKRANKVDAIYIGAVAAVGIRGKAQTLFALDLYIKTLTKQGSVIFTRPITDDGLRLAKQHGFKSVSAQNKNTEEHNVIFSRII